MLNYQLLRKGKSLLPNCVKSNMMLAFQNQLLAVFHNICLWNTKKKNPIIKRLASIYFIIQTFKMKNKIIITFKNHIVFRKKSLKVSHNLYKEI